jgi:hypothetical protein
VQAVRVVTESKRHDAAEDERARLHALNRHEADVRRLERERFARRLEALGPGPQIPDEDFPGCVWDQAPYPDMGDAA